MIHEFILRCILYFRLVHCNKKNYRNNIKNEIGLRRSRRQNWSLFKLKKARVLKIKHANIARSFHSILLEFLRIQRGLQKLNFVFRMQLRFSGRDEGFLERTTIPQPLVAKLLIFNHTLSIHLHFNNSGGVTSREGISEVLTEEQKWNYTGKFGLVLRLKELFH